MPQESFVRAISGDARALDQITDKIAPRVRSMARYYARVTGEDADDLQQEAWAGLLEALPHLDVTIGDPEQHLIRRAKWRLLDAVRRQKSRRAWPIDQMDDTPSSQGNPEAAIEMMAARAFMCSLGGTQRAVLGQLMEGRTWREAGAALGCTSANVAYHVRRIRRQFEEWDQWECKPMGPPSRATEAIS